MGGWAQRSQAVRHIVAGHYVTLTLDVVPRFVVRHGATPVGISTIVLETYKANDKVKEQV